MVIFLVGYMGCGKSTMGRKLAAKMGWDFIDMDHAIRDEQGMSSVAEIFDVKGEVEFRKMERAWLKKQGEDTNVIIATGGGVPCYKDNMELINTLGVSVYLKLDPVMFPKRISLRGREKRPLLRGLNDEQLITFVADKLLEREPYYMKSNIVVDCNGRSDEYITSHIEELIKMTF